MNKILVKVNIMSDCQVAALKIFNKKNIRIYVKKWKYYHSIIATIQVKYKYYGKSLILESI